MEGGVKRKRRRRLGGNLLHQGHRQEERERVGFNEVSEDTEVVGGPTTTVGLDEGRSRRVEVRT